MVLMILGVLTTTAIFAAFWNWIRDFLNGWLRDRLESLFGASKCEWYVSFVCWLDDRVCATKVIARRWWNWFKSKVLRIKTNYRKTANGYVKTTETITVKPEDENKAIRVVTEEEVPWENLPSSVRKEMIHQETDEAELDVTDVINQKAKEKIAVMG